MIDLSNLEKIGQGGEGIVYKYNDKALKIVKTNECESVSKVLENIDLDYIVTPEELIYEDNIFKGYTMRLLENIKPLNTLKRDELLDSLLNLRRDLIRLAEYRILAQDLIPNNSLNSDNQIYFIDTSLYKVCINESDDFIHNSNIKGLKRYLKCLLGQATGSLDGSLLFTRSNADFEEVIMDRMTSTETVEEFAKRII